MHGACEARHLGIMGKAFITVNGNKGGAVKEVQSNKHKIKIAFSFKNTRQAKQVAVVDKLNKK